MTAPGAVLTDSDLDSFEPADYPCRLLMAPEHAPPDAPIGLLWLVPPWPDATVLAIATTLAAGGGILLIAKTRSDLVRQRETLELIVSTAGSA